MEKEAFVIWDESVISPDSEFVEWLHEEGFREASCSKGYFGRPWIFVSITRHTYAYGIPKTKLALPIGNHAITIEEFKTIYSIFRKYQGQKTLDFSPKQADDDDAEEIVYPLTYKEYRETVYNLYMERCLQEVQPGKRKVYFEQCESVVEEGYWYECRAYRNAKYKERRFTAESILSNPIFWNLENLY